MLGVTMDRPFQLLLIEDDPADAALFQDMLSEVDQAMRVEHAEHGQAALDSLRGRPPAELPQLIVVDLNMPVMGGHEFLERAKALDELRHIPVLVLSTSDSTEDIHRSYHNHAGGYVVKPSTYAEYTSLLETVQAYWRGTVRLPTIAELQPGRTGT